MASLIMLIDWGSESKLERRLKQRRMNVGIRTRKSKKRYLKNIKRRKKRMKRKSMRV